jgi:hypothetical protein
MDLRIHRHGAVEQSKQGRVFQSQSKKPGREIEAGNELETGRLPLGFLYAEGSG